MRCSICGIDRNKHKFITIVHDPPIDICEKCQQIILERIKLRKEYEIEKTSKVA